MDRIFRELGLSRKFQGLQNNAWRQKEAPIEMGFGFYKI